MLLQALSELVKDIFRASGKDLHAITFEEDAYADGIPASLVTLEKA